MPGWKINCLKSEDGTNPSIIIPNTTDETNKIESTSSSTDHPNIGKFKSFFFVSILRMINIDLTSLKIN
jgi:hypothetical protein